MSDWVPSDLQREREGFRRRQVARSAAIAAVSTLVVGAVIVAAVVTSPGWARVRETFLDWSEARAAFPAVLEGFWMNVRIFLVASVLVLVVGLLVAVARTLRGPVFFPVRLLAAAYTDLFRGLPLILVILLLGFGVPALRLSGVPDTPVVWGGAALVLTYGAYVAEVIRAGIESVHPSQRWRPPARSGSRTRSRCGSSCCRRRCAGCVPPLLNDAASLQKDSGLVSILGVIDAIRAAQIETAVSFNYTPYVVAGRAVRAADRSRWCGSPTTSACGLAAPAGAAGLPMTPVPSPSEGVRKQYGAAVVLRSVDLTVEEHGVVVLIGASGSGKSTLLRCVNLLETVDDGVIRLDGDRRHGPPRADVDAVRKRVGIVFQAFNLFPHMSVLDNVTLAPRRVHRVPRKRAEDEARELLDRFGLGEKARDYPDRLSGGQQQRAAIVRALATRPRLLLLDEITSALDPELVGEVLTVVRELKDEGMTMVIATHEMGFARQVADEVCFLDGGVVVERGSPERIFAEPAEPRTRQFLRRIVEAGRL